MAKKFPKTNIDFLILQDSYDVTVNKTYTFYEKEHMKFVLFNDIENPNEAGVGNRSVIIKEIAKHAEMNYLLFKSERLP